MKTISFNTDVLPLKDPLFRLALRITLSREEAEDIVQDTLIKVWNRRDRWDEIESIEALAMKICRNLVLDHLRKHENQNQSLDVVPMERPAQEADPLEQTQRQDRIDKVRQIVNSLPEKQRSCLQLRDFEGKSYKEIADILDITEDQVKINIYRARQTVKESFIKIDRYGL